MYVYSTATDTAAYTHVGKDWMHTMYIHVHVCVHSSG